MPLDPVEELTTEALQFLKADGAFDHLVDVVAKIVGESTPSPCASLEAISFSIKERASRTATPPAAPVAPDAHLQPIREMQTLFVKKPELDEEGEPVEPEASDGEEPEIPNLLEATQHLAALGLGLPQEEAFRLHMAVRAFAKATPAAENVRFFGKFATSAAPYYVLECKLDEEPEFSTGAAAAEEGSENEPQAEEPAAEADADAEAAQPDEHLEKIAGPTAVEEKSVAPLPDAEEYGHNAEKSVNTLTYFVCAGPLSPKWTPLPVVTPEMIAIARVLRVRLTGNLLADIPARGAAFPGKEAHLLRCMVARIHHACAISPTGFYSFDEEDEEQAGPLVASEEFAEAGGCDDADSLATADGWAHHVPSLLANGTVAAPPTEEEEEEEEEEEPEEEEEEDPFADVKEKGKALAAWKRAHPLWRRAIDPWAAESDDAPEQPALFLAPLDSDAPVQLRALPAPADRELIGEIPEDADADDRAPKHEIASWGFRKTKFTHPNYSTFAALSRRWPGAVTVAWQRGLQWSFCYVGDGLPVSPFPAVPPAPLPLMAVPECPEEVADPTLEQIKEAEARRADKARLQQDGDEEEED
jgi:hypothetical protein